MKPATRKEEVPAGLGRPPLVLRLRPVVDLTGDQLLELSSLNGDLRLELTAKGELVVMPPTGTETGDRDSEINMQLRLWAKHDGTGVAFDSSTGFTLPNGAIRSPKASWVLRSRIGALTAEQYRKYAPLCPDFVIELHSPSDSLRATQEKMREYLENGRAWDGSWIPDTSGSTSTVQIPRSGNWRTRRPSPVNPSSPASRWTCARCGEP